MYSLAKKLFEKGEQPLPIRRMGKEPLFPFKNGPPDLEVWRGLECNIALLLGRKAVVDIDGPEGKEYADHHFGETGLVSVTPSGGEHRWYRLLEEMRGRLGLGGLPLDIKTGFTSYVLIPPSVGKNGVPYRWIEKSEMATFDPAWLPNPPTSAVAPQFDTNIDEYVAVIMTRAYVSKIEGAHSGHGGHNKTYYVACKIRDRLAGLLSPEECLPIMQEYNERCHPKWSDVELLHKLRSSWDAWGGGNEG